MSIKIGNNDISKIYLGSTEIEKIYQGDTVIYSGGSEPPSPTPQYRWVNIDPNEEVICGDSGDECTAYYKQKKQVSYDSGTTWTDVSPAEYQKGDVYEYNSQLCGCGPLIVYLSNEGDLYQWCGVGLPQYLIHVGGYFSGTLYACDNGEDACSGVRRYPINLSHLPLNLSDYRYLSTGSRVNSYPVTLYFSDDPNAQP